MVQKFDIEAFLRELRVNGADYMKKGDRVFYSAPPESLRSDWEQGFTMPAVPGGNFRILVHGLQDSAGRCIQMLALLENAQKAKPVLTGLNI